MSDDIDNYKAPYCYAKEREEEDYKLYHLEPPISELKGRLVDLEPAPPLKSHAIHCFQASLGNRPHIDHLLSHKRRTILAFYPCIIAILDNFKGGKIPPSMIIMRRESRISYSKSQKAPQQHQHIKGSPDPMAILSIGYSLVALRTEVE